MNLVNLASTIAATEGGGLDPLSHVLPHTLFRIGPLEVTNHLLMGVIAAVLMFLVFSYVASRVRVHDETVEAHLTKGRVAQLFEFICAFLRDEIARPHLGRMTDRYIYFIWTIFFFILFANVLGMIPLGRFTQLIAYFAGSEHPAHWAHWSGTATSNLSLNVPLALCSFAAIIYIGVREAGKHFFAHFAPVPFKPLALLPVAVMLVFMEVLSLIIRSSVLAMRLFGTMLAGHLVLGVLFGMIYVFMTMSPALGLGAGVGVLLLTVALGLLELFIAFLQAFIFTFLTVLFIAEGAAHHEDEHESPAEERVHEIEHEAYIEAVERA